MNKPSFKENKRRKKKVLISRPLNLKGDFYKIVSREGYTVSGVSFIDVISIPFSLPTTINWIFFSSPNGVNQFFASIEPSVLDAYKIGCMGFGTASTLQKFGVAVDFVGDAEVPSVALSFAKIVGSETVLFPGAKISKRSIQKKLKLAQVIDLAIYETKEKNILLSEKYESIVFTSPSNVKAFINSGNSFSENQKVVAIGESTQEELRKFGIKSKLPSSFLEKDWAKALLTD